VSSPALCYVLESIILGSNPEFNNWNKKKEKEKVSHSFWCTFEIKMSTFLLA